MRGSFFSPQEDVDKFFKESKMNDQEGVYACWVTDPEAVKRILPPPLEMVGPVVMAYIINIQKATFASRYTEAAMAIPATYNGVQGLYWVSFILAGPGAFMATLGGREVGGIPKKIADEIRIDRQGDYVHAYFERHGVRVIDIELDLTGQYNSVGANAILGDPKPGDELLLQGLFYKFDVNKDENGEVHFTDARLMSMAFDTTYHSWEKGNAKIVLQDSPVDPWAELKVIEVLGAGYAHDDVDLSWTKVLTEVDPKDVLPYLLSARFDKGPLNRGETSFY